MAWAVELTDEAKKHIAALDTAARRSVLTKLSWLAAHADEVTPTRLAGEWREFFKLRVGDWRVAYTMSHTASTITVHMVEHRGKVYKHRPPR